MRGNARTEKEDITKQRGLNAPIVSTGVIYRDDRVIKTRLVLLPQIMNMKRTQTLKKKTQTLKEKTHRQYQVFRYLRGLT